MGRRVAAENCTQARGGTVGAIGEAMRLTTQTDYALRVLIFLALQDDRSARTADIAHQHGVSLHHLRKVVQALAHAGFIQTERGRGGGIHLVQPPEEIRLGRVVQAIEPDMQLVECMGTEPSACVIAPACRLKAALADARAAFLDELDHHSLADVVGNGRGLRRLLAAQVEDSSEG